MHLDEQALFSDDQAITATAPSTNYVNLGLGSTPPFAPAALKRDIGGGYDIPLLVQVTQAFNNLVALRVDIEVDDNSGFTSARVVGSSGDVALASLKAGYKFPMPVVPPGVNEQYMRLRYVMNAGTVAPTAGTITAGIAAGLQTNG